MTEAEWLASDGPFKMLAHVNANPNDRRSLCLIAASFRDAWDDLPEECRYWLRLAEGVIENVPESRRFLDRLDDIWLEVQGLVDLIDGEKPAGVAGRGGALAVLTGGWEYADEYTFDDPGWVQERAKHAEYVRDIFGNPFRPAAVEPHWLTSTVHDLAAAIYAGRAFDRLPVLADALEDAGCADADVLAHCRGQGPHVRGCWVVDLLLGKS